MIGDGRVVRVNGLWQRWQWVARTLAAFLLYEPLERQRQRVSEITGEQEEELDRRVYRLPGDSKALRGLPAVGTDCIGGAIPGTVPDSDEHLKHLD